MPLAKIIIKNTKSKIILNIFYWWKGIFGLVPYRAPKTVWVGAVGKMFVCCAWWDAARPISICDQSYSNHRLTRHAFCRGGGVTRSSPLRTAFMFPKLDIESAPDECAVRAAIWSVGMCPRRRRAFHHHTKLLSSDGRTVSARVCCSILFGWPSLSIIFCLLINSPP